jgi:hypothetical protein
MFFNKTYVINIVVALVCCPLQAQQVTAIYGAPIPMEGSIGAYHCPDGEDFYTIHFEGDKSSDGVTLDRWSRTTMERVASLPLPTALLSKPNVWPIGLVATDAGIQCFCSYREGNSTVLVMALLPRGKEVLGEFLEVARFDRPKPKEDGEFIIARDPQCGVTTILFLYEAGYKRHPDGHGRLIGVKANGDVASMNDIQLPDWETRIVDEIGTDAKGDLYIRFKILDDIMRKEASAHRICTFSAATGVVHVLEPPALEKRRSYGHGEFAFLRTERGMLLAVEAYYYNPGDYGTDKYEGLLIRAFDHEAQLLSEKLYPFTVLGGSGSHVLNDPPAIRRARIKGFLLHDDRTVHVYGYESERKGEGTIVTGLFGLALDLETAVYDAAWECALGDRGYKDYSDMWPVVIQGIEYIVMNEARGNIGGSCSDEKPQSLEGGGRNDMVPAIVRADDGHTFGKREGLLSVLPEKEHYLRYLFSFPDGEHVFMLKGIEKNQYPMRVY